MSFFRLLLSSALSITITVAVFAEGPYFASGVRVGEVDQTSAIVWVRLTKEPKANFDLLPIFTEGLPGKARDQGAMPLGVVPGMKGELRLRTKEQQTEEQTITKWMVVDENKDFIYQFQLRNLRPGSTYQYEIESRPFNAADATNSIEGQFKTAPVDTTEEPIRFIVSTCQAIRSVDSGEEGHVAYQQMLGFDPHFFVHTGDILYYDKAPLCKNIDQARAKWNLMFSYGHNKNFHRHVTSYFMKDDHDTLKNDCWPGQKYGDLTFAQGLDIFREQVPMGAKTYRTIRWGKHVQIWMTENRDFRSPNTMPDGPNKTILGEEQKQWLKQTILDSDATYKFVITPGPIVGPDKKGKKDNHSNAVFAHEGQELRDFLSKRENLFVICGDRHWQYCSKDPQTGLLEFGCGPINDEHNYGGDPGENPEFHRYFSDKGGFLGITVSKDEAKAEWYTASPKENGKPKVRYTENLAHSE